MANTSTTLIFDPIPFKGGSKIATSDALNCAPVSDTHFLVLTIEPDFWIQTDFYRNHKVKCVQLPSIAWLMRQHHGLGYWLNQAYLLLLILKTIMGSHKVKKVIGASGPGIDMALYGLQKLINIDVIQFIHGNVGLSRSIGYCLANADRVFYLPCARASIRLALQAYLTDKLGIDDSEAVAEHYLSASSYQTFTNGIPASRWPSKCQDTLPVCFWAASLLKWKGLDLLIDAAKRCAPYQPLLMNICYIRPKDICLPVSHAPVDLSYTQWWEDPSNLDEIRSQSSIFVSTSHNEPFGLSILEALAAGMCVVIPQDDAYWDQQLTHNVDCIKYQPNDASSLAHALLDVINNRELMLCCQANARQLALQYRAESQYLEFTHCLNDAQINKTMRIYS